MKSMKLTEALQILNAAKASNHPVVRCILACGLTPLHLATLLAARLQQALPDKRVEVHTPVFGDAAANLQPSYIGNADFILVAIEWSDLDPRLGFRHLGGWKPSQAAAILEQAAATLKRLLLAIGQAATGLPVAVSLPGLRLPPLFLTAHAQASAAALELRARVADFAWGCAALPHVKVIHSSELDLISPHAARYDFRSDLTTGFPYTLSHASALAAAAVACLTPNPSRKGLITDLDDTVWKGLVGEIGAQAIAWDLDRRAQLHGIYQQLLESFAESGILLAVASKNNPEVVANVWEERADVILRRASVFPWEVHWRPKSQSVAAILRAWNVAPDSVVFVDDSPHELAEVQAAYPDMRCLLFPKGAYSESLEFFYLLRELFGKESVLAEDKLRLDSLRSAAAFSAQSADSPIAPHEFLRQLQGVVTLTLNPSPKEERVLQLVNKTNQFNLNGLRRMDAAWQESTHAGAAFVLSVAYEDKLGPLGMIGVVQGKQKAGQLQIETWVLSCRAFSRLIEHHCVAFLFEHFDVNEIAFDYQPTPKNGPTLEFLSNYIDTLPAGLAILRREIFEERRPELSHRVKVLGVELAIN
jgi:FkbH-like protein